MKEFITLYLDFFLYLIWSHTLTVSKLMRKQKISARSMWWKYLHLQGRQNVIILYVKMLLLFRNCLQSLYTGINVVILVQITIMRQSAACIYLVCRTHRANTKTLQSWKKPFSKSGTSLATPSRRRKIVQKPDFWPHQKFTSFQCRCQMSEVCLLSGFSINGAKGSR